MKVRYCLLGSVPALAGILLMIFVAVDSFILQGAFLDGTNAKYGVARDLHMSEEDLSKATYAMVEYVEGKIPDAQVMVVADGRKTGFFTEKELAHLVDVRNLIQGFKVFRNICIIIFFIGAILFLWKRKIRELCVGFWIAWGILLIAAIAVGALAFIDIDLVINGFHEIFFDNDLWILSFSQHRSLWMFQDEMYVDFLRCIAGIMTGILGITIVGTVIGYRAGKPKASLPSRYIYKRNEKEQIKK